MSKPKNYGKNHTALQPSYTKGDGTQVFETEQFRKRTAKSRKKAKMARAARKNK